MPHVHFPDEVSIVMAPVADGNTSAVSVFEHSEFALSREPVALGLKEVKGIGGGNLWLRYEACR